MEVFTNQCTNINGSFYEITDEVMTWTRNNILLFYADVITYPCLNLNIAWANLC